MIELSSELFEMSSLYLKKYDCQYFFISRYHQHEEKRSKGRREEAHLVISNNYIKDKIEAHFKYQIWNMQADLV